TLVASLIAGEFIAPNDPSLPVTLIGCIITPRSACSASSSSSVADQPVGSVVVCVMLSVDIRKPFLVVHSGPAWSCTTRWGLCLSADLSLLLTRRVIGVGGAHPPLVRRPITVESETRVALRPLVRPLTAALAAPLRHPAQPLHLLTSRADRFRHMRRHQPLRTLGEVRVHGVQRLIRGPVATTGGLGPGCQRC